MKTAKEIVNKWALDDGDLLHNAAIEAMKEFAQLHVEAALKAAYDNQVIEQYKKEERYDYPDSSHFRATKQSILNAYPKTNIK